MTANTSPACNLQMPANVALRIFRYRAYGLNIRSEIRFPELIEGGPTDCNDVEIRLCSGNGCRPAGGGCAFTFGADEQVLHWDEVGTFTISGIDRIDIKPAAGVRPDLLAFPLLGPVLAVLLHKRSFLLLHASAVACGMKSAVFLGDKGAGKSTAAAALLKAGHRLLTDDVLALNFEQVDAPLIEPAFPQVKLSEKVRSALGFCGPQLRPRVHPGIQKQQLRVADNQLSGSVPPSAIYVLRRGETASIEKLPNRDALSALIRFSYITRVQGYVLQPDEAAGHFKRCASLAAMTGIYALQVPDGLARLGEIVSCVEDHLVLIDGN